MLDIVVSDEQARILAQTPGLLIVRDRQGKVLGRAFRVVQYDTKPVLTPEQIAQAEKRLDSDGPWYPLEKVCERLRPAQPE